LAIVALGERFTAAMGRGRATFLQSYLAEADLPASAHQFACVAGAKWQRLPRFYESSFLDRFCR